MELKSINTAHLKSRNSLLQETLRPEPQEFSIELEYPLALSESSLNRSFGGFIDSELVTHVNLLPRQILLNEIAVGRVGLIGNVATSPIHQGHGLMRQTMEQIINVAQSQKLDAILLWSDLDDFYTKLGFVKVGKERRFFISKKSLGNCSAEHQIEVLQSGEASDLKLSRLLEIRENSKVKRIRASKYFSKRRSEKILIIAPECFM